MKQLWRLIAFRYRCGHFFMGVLYVGQSSLRQANNLDVGRSGHSHDSEGGVE